jgi:hypothetical protein
VVHPEGAAHRRIGARIAIFSGSFHAEAMPYKVKPLSEMQLKVLKWIGDGCPSDVFSDYSPRISSRALAGRGLVVVSGHGPTWKATLTADGRERLAQPEPQAEAAELSEVDAIIANLIRTGAPIAVELPRVKGDKLCSAAMKSTLRPKGQRLTFTSTGYWSAPYDQALFERYFPDDVDEHPVPVPERIGRYHRVAAAFRDKRWSVSVEHLGRATRIVQAIAVEAERRGYEVALPAEHKRAGYGRNDTFSGDIAVTIAPDLTCLTLRELPPNLGAAHPYQLIWDSWDRTQKVRKNPDFVSTGRLQIEITTGSTLGRPGKFRDGKRQRLEDQLPVILCELEIQHLEHTHSRAAEERKELERRQNWEAAMSRARGLIQEHHKKQMFERQFERWELAQRMNEYVDALEQQVATMSERADQIESMRWIDWARRHVDALNPATSPIRMPTPLKHSDADLAPFLDGWSPYGPERSRT